MLARDDPSRYHARSWRPSSPPTGTRAVWRTHGTDLARRTEPQGAGGARGSPPPGHGQGGAAAGRHLAPPFAHRRARRRPGGAGGDQRPGRRHLRRALRRQRPREAARVGQRDRHPRKGPLSLRQATDSPRSRIHSGAAAGGSGGRDAAPPSSKTVGIVSLGCPKNLVDTEVMLGRLRGDGYEVVSDAKSAETIIVNTCAFIDRAKQESVDTILEMAREKVTGSAQRLVVTGCLTQRYDA